MSLQLRDGTKPCDYAKFEYTHTYLHIYICIYVLIYLREMCSKHALVHFVHPLEIQNIFINWHLIRHNYLIDIDMTIYSIRINKYVILLLLPRCSQLEIEMTRSSLKGLKSSQWFSWRSGEAIAIGNEMAFMRLVWIPISSRIFHKGWCRVRFPDPTPPIVKFAIREII